MILIVVRCIYALTSSLFHIVTSLVALQYYSNNNNNTLLFYWMHVFLFGSPSIRILALQKRSEGQVQVDVLFLKFGPEIFSVRAFPLPTGWHKFAHRIRSSFFPHKTLVLFGVYASNAPIEIRINAKDLTSNGHL